MDNLEIGVDVPGVNQVKELNSQLGQLTAMLQKVGDSGSNLQKLTSQMDVLQSSIRVGFQELESAIRGSGQRTAKIIQESGDQATRAMKTAGESILRADAATWRQVQAVGASNVAKAFSELAQGIPVEAVKARYGQLASEHAAFLNGDVAKLREYNETVTHINAINSEKQKQAALAARADQYAREAAMQDQALRMNKEFDAKRLAAAETAQEKLGAMMAQAVVREQKMLQEAYNLNAAFDAKRLAAAESFAEKQRALNAKASSSPAAMLSAATRAQGLLGQGSSESEVVTATGSNALAIAKNSAEYAKLKQQVEGSKGAITEHNTAMAEAHSFARGLSGALGTLWVTYGSVVPILAGAAIAGSLKKIVEVGKEVEYQLAFVAALSDTPVSLDKFLAVTSGTVVSVKEAAEGMRALAQNGLNATQSLQALPAILNLATIGEMSVAEAALSATGVLTAFGLQLSEIGRVGDIFAKAAATSNTSVASMTESMKTASTASALFKVSIEETAASIGIMAKLNITGTAAGTAFRNILKDLYEPTKKQAEALKAMNIETRDGQGGLKNYTALLDDLRTKTAGMNESGKLNFLSAISDERGAKALIATLSNWDEFKTKLEEAGAASGFTAKAVLSLEDTVEGASKRMSNNLQGSFIKAFTEASPAIQKVITDLGDIAKSQGAVSLFTSLATSVANLTLFVIEHASAIGNLVALYAGLKILSYVTGAMATFGSVMAANTLVTGEATLATRALSGVKALYTTQTVVATEAIVAETIAKEASTVATFSLSTAMRSLSAAAGWIGLVLTAAVTAYQLFINKSSEADKELLKNNNTLDVLNETLDRQIAKLAERNKLWNPQTLKFDAPDVGVSDTLEKSRSEVERLRREVAAARNAPDSMRVDRFGNLQDKAAKLEKQLSAAEKALSEVQDKADLARDKTLTERKGREFLAPRENYASVMSDLEKFYNQRNEKNLDGQLIHTPAQLDVYAKAGQKIDLLKQKGLDPDAIAGAKNSLVQLNAELNKVGSDFTKKDTKAAADTFGAIQQMLQNDINNLKQAEKFLEQSIASKVRTGDLGEMEAAQQIYDARVKLADSEIALIQQQMDKADESENKRRLNAKLTGAMEQAELTKREQANIRANALAEITAKQETELSKLRSEAYKESGQYVKAFDEDNKASFELKSKAWQSDLENLMEEHRLFGTREEDIKRLLALLDELEKKNAAGRVGEQFKELGEKFNLELKSAETSITKINEKGAKSGGLWGALKAAEAAQDLRSKAIPALEATIAQMEELNLATKDGITLEGYKNSLEKMRNEVPAAYTELFKDINDLGQAAFSSLFSKSTSTFKDAVKKMRDTFQNDLLKMMYNAFAKPFVMQITASIAGSLGLSGLANAAGIAGGSGSGAGIGSIVSNLSTIGSSFSTIMSGLGSLGSGTLGSFVSGLSGTGAGIGSGLASSFGLDLGTSLASTLGPSISSGLASGITGLATAAPWIAGAFAVYSLGKAAFGMGDKQTTGMNVTGTYTGGNLDATRNHSWSQQGGFLRGDRSGTWSYNLANSTAMADGVAYQDTASLKSDQALLKVLNDAYAGMATSTETFAGKLGVSAEGLKSLVTNISFDMGKTAEETQANITKALSGVADAMATQLIPNVMDFAKTGETASAVLTRLATSLGSVNEMFRGVGLTLLDVSIAGADMASKLIDAFGGASNMSTAFSTYFSKYFTEAEKLQKQTDALKISFKSLGVEMPTTIEGFRKMIEQYGSSANLATDAGRQLFAGLMQLAGAFYDVTTAASTASTAASGPTQAQLDSVDVAYSRLERSVNAAKQTETLRYEQEKANIQAGITQAEAAAATAKANADAFKSALSGMKIASVALESQSRVAAQQVIQQAKDSGNATATPEVQRAMTTLAQPSEKLFSSFQDYARDFYKASNNIAALQDAAQAQADAQDAVVASLKAQLNDVDRYHNINMAKLDAQLEEAKTQVDALHGIDNSVIDVGLAIDQLNTALTGAGGKTVTSGRLPISQMQGDYNNYFDNTAVGSQITFAQGILTKLDAVTAAYFGTAGKQVLLHRGDDLSQVALSDADIYKQWYKQYGFTPKVPGYASGGTFGGGMRLVGENGPELEVTGPSRIYDASTTSSMLNGMSPEDLAALLAEVQMMREDARAIAYATIKVLKDLYIIADNERVNGKYVRGATPGAPANVKVIP